MDSDMNNGLKEERKSLRIKFVGCEGDVGRPTMRLSSVISSGSYHEERALSPDQFIVAAIM